jgi:hypothetical protein
MHSTSIACLAPKTQNDTRISEHQVQSKGIETVLESHSAECLFYLFSSQLFHLQTSTAAPQRHASDDCESNRSPKEPFDLDPHKLPTLYVQVPYLSRLKAAL